MLLVVGGQSRKVGKTSVVAAIVRATREFGWIAVKLAGHRHDQQPDRGDTSRYLEAGAERTLLLEAATADLAPLVAAGANIICESTRLARGIRPDCSLMLVDPSREEWKESAREFAARADALVITAEGSPPAWLGPKPLFRVAGPVWASADLIEFVLDRLRATGTQSAAANRREE